MDIGVCENECGQSIFYTSDLQSQIEEYDGVIPRRVCSDQKLLIPESEDSCSILWDSNLLDSVMMCGSHEYREGGKGCYNPQ